MTSLPAELVLRSSCGCPPGSVTRHHVAAITRGQASQAAKLPCAPPRVPSAGPGPCAVGQDHWAGPTAAAGDLVNDESTER